MNQNFTIENYLKILDLFEFIRTQAKISKEETKKYYSPLVVYKSNERKNIFYWLCSSAQNKPFMDVIHFHDLHSQNYNAIKESTFDFDTNKMIQYYDTADEFKSTLIRRVFNNENAGNKAWNGYAETLFYAAQYLEETQYINFIDLINKININENIEEIDFIKIAEIKNRIKGMGVALVCDWLKQAGCKWILKPDRHIIVVWKRLLHGEILEDSKKEISASDQIKKEIIKDFVNWAHDLRAKDPTMTAYKLDRIIWIVRASRQEKFFLDHKTIPQQIVMDYAKENGNDLLIKRNPHTKQSKTEIV